jgi:hypothetical protein
MMLGCRRRHLYSTKFPSLGERDSRTVHPCTKYPGMPNLLASLVYRALASFQWYLCPMPPAHLLRKSWEARQKVLGQHQSDGSHDPLRAVYQSGSDYVRNSDTGVPIAFPMLVYSHRGGPKEPAGVAASKRQGADSGINSPDARPGAVTPTECKGADGGRLSLVENTLPAFANSVAIGVHLLEMDVQLTADGQVGWYSDLGACAGSRRGMGVASMHRMRSKPTCVSQESDSP